MSQPKVAFEESCCDGGSTTLGNQSALPCGCDPGCGWECQEHDEHKYEPGEYLKNKNMYTQELTTQTNPRQDTFEIAVDQPNWETRHREEARVLEQRQASPVKTSDRSVMSRGLADDAFTLVNGGRQDAYGRPERSFEAIASVWNGLLLNKLAKGERITPTDVALLMVGLKITRETNQRKKDNVIDAHGYLFLHSQLAGYE